MQELVDFFFSIYLSMILTGIYIFLRFRFKKFKTIGLYFYNIVTYGIVKTMNQEVLLPIFGCGCVPIIKQNKLNIGINTNDVTRFYYFITLILIIYLSMKRSKNMEKEVRIFYILTVSLENILVSYLFIKMLMWL